MIKNKGGEYSPAVVHDENISNDSSDTVNNDTSNSNSSASSESVKIHGGDAEFTNAPWKFKAIALVTALFLSFGAHFSGSALSAMKAQIKFNLQISNTRYGVISASVAIINTVFPIAGGIFIDLFGSVWGTLLINLMVIIGSLLTAIAGKYKSYVLMVVARVVFGIGSGLIVTMQESLLSKWFRTKHLSIAIGLQLSISRLSTFLGTLVANSVASATGDWVWPFWLSFILCGFSVLMNLIYALVVKHLKGRVVLTENEKELLKKKKIFKWDTVLKFPPIFWHIICIEFIYSAVWSSFQTIATDLIIHHFGTEDTLAGYKASASQAVPIVATPLLGLFMDWAGRRITIQLFSAIFLILSCGLLGWTFVDPVVGMIFYSISLAFGPITMITSLGLLLPTQYIGTGLGIFKSSNNIGTAILDVIVGVVQDNTEGQSYNKVMLVFIILGGIGFVIISLLWLHQFYFHQNILEVGREKRAMLMHDIKRKENELAVKGEQPYDETPIHKTNYILLGLFIAALVTCWVLYFVYSIHGKG